MGARSVIALHGSMWCLAIAAAAWVVAAVWVALRLGRHLADDD